MINFTKIKNIIFRYNVELDERLKYVTGGVPNYLGFSEKEDVFVYLICYDKMSIHFYYINDTCNIICYDNDDNVLMHYDMRYGNEFTKLDKRVSKRCIEQIFDTYNYYLETEQFEKF